MKTTYYEITYPPYIFYAIVLYDESMWRIKFGGKEGCVMFSVYEDEDYPILDGLAYGPNCAINMQDPYKGLLPTSGTVDMANAAFAFVAHLFPDKKAFMLKDQSKITCNKNKIISLQHYYIVKYMKTWYEAKFNAKLTDKGEHQKYKKLLQLLQASYSPQAFQTFSDLYLRNTIHEKKFKQVASILKPYYETSTTYSEFFRKVAEDHDCIIFDRWLFRFMTSVSNMRFSDAFWTINYPQNVSIQVRKTKQKPQFNFIIYGGMDFEATDPVMRI